MNARASGMAVALAWLLLITPAVAAAQDSCAGGTPLAQLGVQVTRTVPEHWAVDQPTTLALRITNNSSAFIDFNEVNLLLPSELVCGSRRETIAGLESFIAAVPVGKCIEVDFTIPEGGWRCGLSGMLRRPNSVARFSINYNSPKGIIDTQTLPVTLAWSAPWWVVMVGGIVGVALARALLAAGRRIRLLKAGAAEAPFWPELAFGVITVAIITLLGWSQQLPDWLSVVTHAETFAHGLVLGLGSRTLGQTLLSQIAPPKAQDTPPGPGDSPKAMSHDQVVEQ